MTKRILPSLTLGASMLLSVSTANAQIPAFGNLGLVDGLSGVLSTLSSGGSQNLGPLSGSLFAVDSLLPALNNPTLLVPTTLGGTEIVVGFVPSGEVLLTNPLAILGYLSDGGTLLSPQLGPLPAIPLISQPLALGGLGGLDGLGLPGLDDGALPIDMLPLDLLNPTSVIDQVLGLLSGLAASAPAL